MARLETYGETLYVRRILRSGERVHFDGTVIVEGDVNPGAEVIATGDVIVLGVLRGMAQAGAAGDATREVMALGFRPVQVRIGRLISRPPDGEAALPPTPERARVVDGRIVIERWLAKRSGGKLVG
jgi:septum site-determining protein MinC